MQRCSLEYSSEHCPIQQGVTQVQCWKLHHVQASGFYRVQSTILQASNEMLLQLKHQCVCLESVLH